MVVKVAEKSFIESIIQIDTKRFVKLLKLKYLTKHTSNVARTSKNI